MKKYKSMVWGILIFQLIVLCITVATAKVDDMKLTKGDTYEFNEGWTIIREDGTVEENVTLPYFGESKPYEKITMINTIPLEFCGKSMSFLSADKSVDIMVEGRDIYTFGMHDEKRIGKTPGSVMVYADIPDYHSGDEIEIVTCSPYANFASYATAITVGKRDVLILKHVENNALDILCAFIIIIIGVVILVLSIYLKMTHNTDFGSMYMSIYLMLLGIYHLGETKLLTIFIGNQFLYSNMVFLIIMAAPMFFLMHVGYSIPQVENVTLKLMYLPVFNITIQIILQMLNIVDFINMAFVSHGILGIVLVSTIILLYIEIRKMPRKKYVLHFLGTVAGALGAAIDMYRTYTIKVGDLGKFSRYGTAIFAILGITVLLNDMIDYQIGFVEDARDEAEQANRAKSQFLANMSHEIRTPINAVLGLDTMILRESKESTIRGYAKDIQTAGENLLSLINDILDFSKIESGKMEIVEAEYDFSSLIHDVMNMIGTKADSKSLKLKLELDENLPSALYGDDVRIRQILINLMNNAVKYTEHGSVSLSINGEIEERYVNLHFSVKDTGIGIKPEDIDKLFAEFERIEEKRNRNVEGTGLGMSITCRLLGMMGSKLEVSSVYGEGSEFYFAIRQKIVNDEPIGDLGERINSRSDKYEYRESFVAPDARVLVVDDNTINRNVFVALLKRTRMQIEEAASGQECIDKSWMEKFDIIFLDHMMPEMDGVETLRKMRSIANYPNRNTPVVALTANAISGAKEMYLEEGFDDFLSKPIVPEKLEKMIVDYLPQELLLSENEVKELAKEESSESRENNLPEIEGVDWKVAMEQLKDIALVESVARDFGKFAKSHRDTLIEKYHGLLEAKDEEKAEAFKQYRVQVHSMKTSAAMIGAVAVSEIAKLLEYDASEERMDKIERFTDTFIDKWDALAERISVNFAEKIKTEAADYVMVKQYLDLIEQAVDDMDLDAMDELANSLKGYEYPDEERMLVDNIVQSIFNIDYDKCVELVKELRGKID